MPVANPKKTINLKKMDCDDTATVTISFESAASLAFDPADIILIMDRSSSMTADRMTFAKEAAKQFIDIVDGARNAGTRMGIVSFGTDATQDVALTDNFNLLKPAIDSLTRGGYTNHKAAFEAAGNLLNIPSAVRQVVVMFTDGETTASDPAEPVVQALKDKGIEIFCIGLATDPAPLNLWATDPDSTHVAYTDENAQLNRVFKQIASEVVLAGVRDAEIKEQLMPYFEIVKIHTPQDGTVDVTGPQNLTWKIDSAGIKEQPNFTSLAFDIKYIGSESGTLSVNESISYTDRDGNSLDFPNPSVTVDCSDPEIYPDKCSEPIEFTAGGCKDAVNVSVDNIALQGLGRIVKIDATLKSICPNKRVAVSIILMEKSPDGTALPRGVKHFLIPAHEADSCKDIVLKCINFSLPEALDANGNIDSICNSRNFSVRVVANYVDTDFICCQ